MRVEVLGVAQDAGVPHVGCSCGRCERARAEPSRQRYAASVLVETSGGRFLVDATPDVRFQVDGGRLDGVFLTHEHFGHVGGLGQFGTEGLDAAALPVYCSAGLANVLESNVPFDRLDARGQVEFVTLPAGGSVAIGDGTMQAVEVEHRTEMAPTVAYLVSNDRTLLYLPDLDRWTDGAVALVEEADVALVDGTFFRRSEVDRFESVPHPSIRESMRRLAGVDTEVWFTHLNHTNPALDGDSDERRAIQAEGFRVAERGDELML